MTPERACPDCEVRTTEPECWVCGQAIEPTARLFISSQYGNANAMSETQWAEVRRQIL